jgi:L-alanine-DL-glutamate epimerase-like enolase superfamily enzyme
MAVLSALAATSDCNIADLLLATDKTRNVQSSEEETENSSGKVSSRVQICALLDSEGSPEEVACAAEKLVEKGFHTMKLKVSRKLSH